MCKIIEDLRDEARKEADKERSRQNALTMIKLGKLTFEEIALCSGLSVEEVKALAEGKPA